MEIKGVIDTKKLAADAHPNEDDLNTEFQEQAGKTVYWGAQAAKAAHQELRAKNNLELTEARLDNVIRSEAAAEGKKLTENAIKAAVKLDADYQDALKLHHDAIYVNNLAKTATTGMATKRDMLISLGANHRAEAQGQIRMNQESPGDRISAALRGVHGAVN